MINPQFTPEELELEEWRDVIGYEGHYKISNLGRARSVKPNYASKILSPEKTKAGRLRYILSKDGVARKVHVHKLVMLAFVGAPDQGKECNHIDGNGLNPRLNNLEYLTHKENIEHACRLGLNARGERVNTAKITSEQALAIRGDPRPASIISKECGLTESSVYRIKNRETWKHLPEAQA